MNPEPQIPCPCYLIRGNGSASYAHTGDFHPMNDKPHFNVTAGLVWHDGKILITRRPKGSHLGGYWEFPGGKQEGNESLPSCLEREMREELGIAVKIEKFLLKVDHDYETKSISLHVFRCTWLSGTPTPIGCDEIRWVKPGELADYQFPPPDIRILEFITRPSPSHLVSA